MNEKNSDAPSEPPVEVLRHRAAIRRTEPSLPLKCILRDNLLTSERRFFDYGCGYGDDIDQVTRLGMLANGWDPAYRPEEAIQEAEVVNIGYVVNVIEDLPERAESLKNAWALAKSVLVVAARIAVDGSGEGDFEFGDGVITRLQTFQKYFTQTELRLYIDETLGVESVPAAPGVFYVFKDLELKQTYAASKYRRRTFAPRKRVAEIEFDRNKELLESLMARAAELGRMPHEDEFSRTREVIERCGTLKRAIRLIRKVTGADPWDEIRQSRVDDLRVYLALARFPKRPKLGEMPQTLQRDIKEFFGSYRNACDSADMLLFDSGEAEMIDIACQESPQGRLTSNALFVHRSAVSALPPVLRVFEGCARAYVGDIADANIVKLHRFSGKVSYMSCPKFDSLPHPPIRRTVKVSLRDLYMQCIDHTENKNPLLLDRKECMLEKEHPWFDRFQRFTLQEEQHGLLREEDDLRLAMDWHLRLKESGLKIRGYRLLYREGVKRKRLPPRRTADGEAVPETQPEENDKLLDHETLEENRAIDNDDEGIQVDMSFKRASELPSRSRRFGVGKEIGYAVYVHRDYEDRLGQVVQWAKKNLHESCEYNVVKLNQRNDAVSFIHCPGFDTEEEPAISAITVVSADGSTQQRTMPSDPYIYHHKWLFVDDDYDGFDVDASKKRSEQWNALDHIDRSRIGRKSYWEEFVVRILNK